MKKTVLTGFALLLVSAAVAQNAATLRQVGSYQTSQQKQAGNQLTSTVMQGSGSDVTVNTYNQSLTDQTGRFHAATVNQLDNASNNAATITQTGSGPLAADGHKATITQQTNSGGTAPARSAIFGRDATAGKGNVADILQQSTRNEASISQSDNSSSNYGRIVQTGSSNSQPQGAPGSTYINQDHRAAGNAALIEQPGNENGAQISQTTNSAQNEATVRQVSSNNFARIDQNDQSSLNTADVSQSGGASRAFVRQESRSIGNRAGLTQAGNGNVGTIEQTGTSGGTGIGNVANLYQQGNNNTQTSIGQNNTSYGNRAYLNQYGDNNNETRITQSGESHGNTARIDQGGDGPGGTYSAYGYAVNGGRAVIEQNNFSYNNTARIGQSGDGHDAQIYQNSNVSNSEAYIDQYPGGAGHNVGYIRQENQTGGLVRITQNAATYPGGNYGQNEARAFQGSLSYGVSSGNVLTIVQENSGNRSFAEQFGTANLMEIKQYGNGNLVFGPGSDNRPAGIAHQDGVMNKAYIIQNSTGGVANSAYLSQSGSHNTATIVQNGSPNE